MIAVRHPSQPPVFDHLAFPMALGFAAGFIDIFGFLAWHGLLAAHVTGNLIFLAIDIANGRYQLVMKLLALPIFAASVAASAWFIEATTARGRHPLPPAIVLQAAALGLCLIAGLALPAARGPDDAAAVVAGSIALFAMAAQNTTMRMILNNLPPTTVMTGNITYVVSEAVRWSGRSATLAPRARLIGTTLAAFTVGAIAGGFSELRVGYVALVVPIMALLALLPVARGVLRAAQTVA